MHKQFMHTEAATDFAPTPEPAVEPSDTQQRLASHVGIAHDVAQLLRLVEGRADLLNHTWSWEHAHAGANEIRMITQCAARLLARSAAPQEQPSVDVAAMLPEIKPLLSALSGPGVYVAHLCNVAESSQSPISRAELEQILINLVRNACDAGANHVGIEVDALPCCEPVEKANCEQGFVTISVVDNGPGVSESMIDDITNRFFSDQGPDWFGLGLSIVNRIAHEAGGYLGIWNNPDEGARATVRLPLNCSKHHSASET